MISKVLLSFLLSCLVLSDGVHCHVNNIICSDIPKSKCPSVPDGDPEPVLTLLPIANDCTKFIKCERGYQHIKDCPDGLHFSPGIDVCDWPENVNCVPCLNNEPETTTTEYQNLTTTPTDHTITANGTTPTPAVTPANNSTTPVGPKECEPESCPVIPVGEKEKVLTLLKVPSDCSKFIHCDRGVPYLKDCPAGLHFNPGISVCDWPANVSCVACSGSGGPTNGTVPTESTTTTSTTTEETTTPAPSVTPENNRTTPVRPKDCEPESCPVIPDGEEEKVLTLLKVPSDCSKFIHCDRGVPYLKDCPAGLHFNPGISACDWPANVSCVACSGSGGPTNGTVPTEPTTKSPEETTKPTDHTVTLNGTTPAPPVTPENNSTITVGPTECEPESCPVIPDGEEEKVLTLLKVPSDCSKFIHCDRGVPYLKDCPTGLHFNPGIRVCDWPANVSCVACSGSGGPTNGTVPTEPTTKSPEETTKPTDHTVMLNGTTPAPPVTPENNSTITVGPAECEPESCPVIPDGEEEKVLTLLKVPSDCSKFIHCDRGVPYLKDCPTGLHFNPGISVCDWPANVSCVACSGSGGPTNGTVPTEPTTKLPEETTVSIDDTITLNGTTPTPPVTPENNSTTPVGQAECEPESCPVIPDGEEEKVLTLLKVPSDCSKFIHCDRSVPYLKDCPTGLHFNPGISVCDWPANVSCVACSGSGGPTNVTVPTEPTTKSPEETTKPTDRTITLNGTTPTPPVTPENNSTTPVGQAECKPESCPVIPDGEEEKVLTLLKVPFDCSKFIHCDRGVPYLKDCPTGLHFNPGISVCDWPANVSCVACSGSGGPIIGTVPTEPTTKSPEETTVSIDDTITLNGTTPTPPVTPENNSTTPVGQAECKPESCPVIPDGEEEKVLTLLKVPSDCSKFIHCDRGVPYLKDCPTGLHFNPGISVCDWPANVSCVACSGSGGPTNGTVPTEPTTKLPEETTVSIDDTITLNGTTPTPPVTPENNSTTPVGQAECEPESCPVIPDGQEEKVLTLLKVPSDCSKFIHCDRGVPYLKDCPTGLHFNPGISVCDWPANVSCVACSGSGGPTNVTVPTEPTTKSPEETTKPTDHTITLNGTTPTPPVTPENNSTTPVGQAECKPESCPAIPDGEEEKVLTLLKVPSDCSKFIHCDRGVPYLKDCPTGLHFNPGISVCDWPANVSCVACSGSGGPTNGTVPTEPTTKSPEETTVSIDDTITLNGTTPTPPVTPENNSTTPVGQAECKPESCPVIPDGEEEKVLTLLKVPSDCSKFIHCDRGVPYLKDCPTGLHFNPGISVCDWPANVSCVACSGSGGPTNGTVPTEPTTKLPEETTVSIDDTITLNGTTPTPPVTPENNSTTPVGQAECEPESCPVIPDGEEEKVLTLLKVPSDCSKFIHCDRGVPYLKDCPTGLHFNPGISVCDWPANVSCVACSGSGGPTNGTVPTEPTTKSPEETTVSIDDTITLNGTTPTPPVTPENNSTTPVGQAECKPESCPVIPDGEEEKVLTLLKVPSDCSKFIHCDRGVPYLKDCPTGLHFNPGISVCDWPANVSCVACSGSGGPTNGTVPTEPTTKLPEETTVSIDDTITLNGTTPTPPVTPENNSTTPVGQAECEPESCPVIPDGEEEKVLTLLKVPSDCSKFIHCDRGVPYLKDCPTGLHFNPGISVCDWPANVSCVACSGSGGPTNLTVPTEPTTKSPEETTKPTDHTITLNGTTPTPPVTPENNSTTPVGQAECKPESCPVIPDGEEEKVLTLLKVPSDCSKFIHCDRGVPYLKDCPTGLHFNPGISVCDWPANVSCVACSGSGGPTNGTVPTEPTTKLPEETTVSIDDTITLNGTTPTPPVTPENNSTTPVGQAECEPESCPVIPDGEEEKVLTLLKVPSDCSKFIHCDRGVPYLKDCPTGLHFNPGISVCDWPANVSCAACSGSGGPTNVTVPTEPTTKSPEETTKLTDHTITLSGTTPTPPVTPENNSTTPVGQAECKPESCPVIPDGEEEKVLTLLKVPSDCSKFIHCDRGVPYLKDCPTGLHFNPGISVCDWPANVSCVACSGSGGPTNGTVPTEPTTKLPEETTVSIDDTITLNGTTPTPPVTPENNSTTPVGQAECEPEYCPVIPDGEEEKVLTLLKVPSDCSKFIHCDRGVPYLKDCPTGLHFNPGISVCDWPANVSCVACSGSGGPTNGTVPTELTTKSPEETTKPTDHTITLNGTTPTPPVTPENNSTTPVGQAECEPESCPVIPDGEEEKVLTLLKVPSDCSKFIHCDRGVPYLKDCPTGLHFNSGISVCDWPANVSCVACSGSGGPTNGTVPTEPTTTTSTTTEETTTPTPSVTPSNNSTTPVGRAECEPESCPVIPDGEEEKVLTLLKVPSDCSKFIHCDRGVPYLKDCPTGLYFNPGISVCDWPANVSCVACSGSGGPTNGTVPTEPTTKSSEETTKPTDHTITLNGTTPAPPVTPENNSTTPVGQAECEPESCPVIPDGEEEKVLTLLKVPSDCSKFIHCDRGVPYLKDCPTGLHFNPGISVCDWPANVSCVACSGSGGPANGTVPNEPTTTTSTTTEETTTPTPSVTPSNNSTTPVGRAECEPESCPVIPDGEEEKVLTLLKVPSDCSKFIHCDRGVPYLKDCPTGLHFNPGISVCDWPANVSCVACSGSGGPTNGTVPTEPTITTTEETTTPTASVTPSNNSTTPVGRAECEPESCPVIPDGEEEKVLTLLIVPSDCSKFIHCDRGVPYLKDCPTGLHFNPGISVCDWPANVSCVACSGFGGPTNGTVPNEPTTTTSTTTEETTTPTPSVTPSNNSTTPVGRAECEPESCPVIPDGEEEKVLTLLKVPSDCSKFIHCDRGVPYLKDCPAGLHFNPGISVCDWPANVSCVACSGSGGPTNGTVPNEPTTTTTTSTTMEETTTPTPPVTPSNNSTTPVGRAECEPESCPVIPDGEEEKVLTLLKVPSDCSKFIHCDRGVPYLKDCPTGLHFNPSISVCDWPVNVHCRQCELSSSTKAPEECGEQQKCPSVPANLPESKLTLLPIVNNCKKFIICDRGVPYEMRCPDELHFNRVLDVCDWPKDANCPKCN